MLTLTCIRKEMGALSETSCERIQEIQEGAAQQRCLAVKKEPLTKGMVFIGRTDMLVEAQQLLTSFPALQW